jgi:hypothetical protein
MNVGISGKWHRIAAIFALASLLLVVAAPVAADGGDQRTMHDNDNDKDKDRRERGAEFNREVRERNDRLDFRESCTGAVFHPLADVDVNSGSIVGGPYSGWPVVVVSEAGHGLPLGADTAVPTTYVPLSIGPSGGLGQATPPIPALARFALVQRVSASQTFTTDQGDLILLVRSDIISPDSCRR